MAEFGAPSFSLGLDLDPYSEAVDVERDASFPAPTFRILESDDDGDDFNLDYLDGGRRGEEDPPRRALKHLKRGAAVTPSSAPPLLTDEDIEEVFSDGDDPRLGVHAKAHSHPPFSSSKLSLCHQRVLNKESTAKLGFSKSASAFNSSSFGRFDSSNGQGILLSLTVSPLRKIQLLDSDLDDSSSSRCNHQTFDIEGAQSHYRQREISEQNKAKLQANVPRKELYQKQIRDFPTPALDDFCKEYSASAKKNEVPPGRKEDLGVNNHKSSPGCFFYQTESISQMNSLNENVELSWRSSDPLPPSFHYFNHKDSRIRELVHRRLPNFSPIGAANQMNQKSEVTDIDYMSQFYRRDVPVSRGSKNNAAVRCKKKSKQNVAKADMEEVAQASGSWVNLRDYSATPKIASAFNSSSFGRFNSSDGQGILLSLTVSPLRMIQLLDSESDDSSSSRCNHQTFDIKGAQSHDRQREISEPMIRNHQNKAKLQTNVPRTELYQKQISDFATPALDDFCKEYSASAEKNEVPPGWKEDRGVNNPKSSPGCFFDQTESISQMNSLNENVELSWRSSDSLPPPFHYFNHKDSRIRELVHRRLPNFSPIGAANQMNQKSEVTDIDYMSQFYRRDVPVSRGSKNNAAVRCKKKSKQNVAKADMEEVPQASGSWVNPRDYSVTPKSASAFNSSSFGRFNSSDGQGILPSLTVSPLRKIQLLDSYSDDSSSSRCNHQTFDIEGAQSHDRQMEISEPIIRNHQNKAKLQTNVPRKELYQKQISDFATPALVDFCNEYSASAEKNEVPPGWKEDRGVNNHKSSPGCSSDQTESISQMNSLNEYVELSWRSSDSLPPPFHYFNHKDSRIWELVHCRLPNFSPIGAANQSQFYRRDVPVSRGSKNNAAVRSKKKRKQNVAKANMEEVPQASGSWVNPRDYSATPKDVGRRRTHANGNSRGHWFTGQDGRKVYVTKDGQELTGQPAYRHYRKESSTEFKRSRKKTVSKKKTKKR